jgi:hypothetical protein
VRELQGRQCGEEVKMKRLLMTTAVLVALMGNAEACYVKDPSLNVRNAPDGTVVQGAADLRRTGRGHRVSMMERRRWARRSSAFAWRRAFGARWSGEVDHARFQDSPCNDSEALAGAACKLGDQAWGSQRKRPCIHFIENKSG